MPEGIQPPVSASARGEVQVRLESLEAQVRRLAERLDEMEQRVSGLPLPALPSGWPLPEVAQAGAKLAQPTRWVTLLGRSCLVLGGAFLIRALTDGGILPGAVGVALGLLFAATWIAFAHRAASSGAALSAGFHGAVAAVIGYPLILESTTRLGVMSPAAGAVTLLAFTGLLLGVAWRDRLSWMAWTGVLACLVSSLLLGRATGTQAELTGVLVVLAAASCFWLGERWQSVRWAPAVVLDLAVLREAFTLAPGLPVVALALAALSLGVAFSRTARARPIGAFEVFQTTVGLGIATFAALRLAREVGAGSGSVAAALVAASLLAALFAGWVVPRRGNRELDFLFHAALSLALLAAAVSVQATGELRGLLWTALAVAAVVIGRRSHPLALWSMAALLAAGGAVASGALQGRVGPASVGAVLLLVIAYAATVPPLRSGAAGSSGAADSRIPATAILALGGASLAELVVHAVPALSTDPARLGAARTVAAVATAFSLALLRRRLARPELSWVATLALVLGGLELAFAELPRGRPLTLLVSFVLYGAGLIVVPRLAPPGRDLPWSSGPSQTGR